MRVSERVIVEAAATALVVVLLSRIAALVGLEGVVRYLVVLVVAAVIGAALGAWPAWRGREGMVG